MSELANPIEHRPPIAGDTGADKSHHLFLQRIDARVGAIGVHDRIDRNVKRARNAACLVRDAKQTPPEAVSEA